MKCDAGYYCKGGSKTKVPVGLQTGDRCSVGYYCDVGSGFQTPCPPGLACPNTGMSLADALTFPCDAGYFCVNKAIRVDPGSNDGGGSCPAGYYCPSPLTASTTPALTDYDSGTRHPYPCEPGTYRASGGGDVKATSCTICDPGYYCPDYATTSITICDEGWYCDKSDGGIGETSPRPEGKFCPVGHYCSQGVKLECENGKYQD